MKTTIDIPNESLDALLRLTGARTKRDAILTAVEEYTRRREVAQLVATFGTWQMDSNKAIEAADLAAAGRSR